MLILTIPMPALYRAEMASGVVCFGPKVAMTLVFRVDWVESLRNICS